MRSISARVKLSESRHRTGAADRPAISAGVRPARMGVRWVVGRTLERPRPGRVRRSFRKVHQCEGPAPRVRTREAGPQAWMSQFYPMPGAASRPPSRSSGGSDAPAKFGFHRAWADEPVTVPSDQDGPDFPIHPTGLEPVTFGSVVPRSLVAAARGGMFTSIILDRPWQAVKVTIRISFSGVLATADQGGGRPRTLDRSLGSASGYHRPWWRSAGGRRRSGGGHGVP